MSAAAEWGARATRDNTTRLVAAKLRLGCRPRRRAVRRASLVGIRVVARRSAGQPCGRHSRLTPPPQPRALVRGNRSATRRPSRACLAAPTPAGGRRGLAAVVRQHAGRHLSDGAASYDSDRRKKATPQRAAALHSPSHARRCSSSPDAAPHRRREAMIVRSYALLSPPVVARRPAAPVLTRFVPMCRAPAAQICIGPVCVPVGALVPTLIVFAHQRGWLRWLQPRWFDWKWYRTLLRKCVPHARHVMRPPLSRAVAARRRARMRCAARSALRTTHVRFRVSRGAPRGDAAALPARRPRRRWRRPRRSEGVAPPRDKGCAAVAARYKPLRCKIAHAAPLIHTRGSRRARMPSPWRVRAEPHLTAAPLTATRSPLCCLHSYSSACGPTA